MLLALIPVMFTYSGWNAAAYVAEEVRSPEQERAVGARPRDVDRHRHLPVAERAVSVRAAGRRPGCGARRPAHRHGGATAVWNGRRESPGRLFDRQHHGQHQRDDDCRTPRVLRHGPRRGVCGAGRARASEVSRAHSRADCAVGVERRSGSLGDLVGTGQLHRLCADPVFRHRGVRGVCPPLSRAGHTPAISRLGLSVGARDLRHRERAHPG